MESWKEIAAFLGRSEKTVRRWEETEGLPVRRLYHEKRASVYAYTTELEQWRETRNGAAESDPVLADAGQESVSDGHPLLTTVGGRTTRRFSGPPLWRVAIGIVVIAGIGLFAGMFLGRLRHSSAGSGSFVRIQSLAVLPFKNISGDPEQEYFADGMTDELITALARIGSVRLISRTSVIRYKDTRKSVPEITRELNVDALVEGAVLRSGDRIRLSVQLITPSPERHVWADVYEGDIRDVLDLQREAAQNLGSKIGAR